MADQRITKWTSWIEGAIKSEVVTMHFQRATWRQYQEILDDNGTLPDSYWWGFMRDIYGITQAVAVRRLADEHKDAQSLGKLVAEIASDPERITQEFWLGLWSNTDRLAIMDAENAWRKQYGGTVDRYLDPVIPQADLQTLRDESEKVKDYVDRHLAHMDRQPLPASDLPTLDEVHDAVDVIGELFSKYSNLFTAGSWAFLEPVVQYDWKAVFRVPWMKPGSGLIPGPPGP